MTAPIATLYRMDSPEHLCPYGLKARALLKRHGYAVIDRALHSRTEADAFKREHDVTTMPQAFIDGARIGGYDALRRFFGRPLPDPEATSYRPVIALFAMTALMALALMQMAHGTAVDALRWFIALSMCVLAMLKLQDVERFSTMFLSYDLLAQRWLAYAYVYPLIEGGAGLLMLAGVLHWLSIPLALAAGSIGAVSVFKAVYLDRRTLKCACVGGSGKVPLGFVSLTENLMMVAMALWMLWETL